MLTLVCMTDSTNNGYSKQIILVTANNLGNSYLSDEDTQIVSPRCLQHQTQTNSSSNEYSEHEVEAHYLGDGFQYTRTFKFVGQVPAPPDSDIPC